MTYSKIELDKLMAFEYQKVEGGLSQIDQRDLQAILPKGMTADALLEKFAAGEYVLLTDSPITPLLIQASSNFVLNEWQINPDAELDFQPSALIALQNRLNMGGIGGGSSAFTDQNNGNLHPAQPIHYTPEPVVPDSSTQQRQAPLAYEYNIEIAFSSKAPHLPSRLTTQLTDTNGKNPQANWDASPTKYGAKYTIKTDSKAPRNLRFSVANDVMGLSLKGVNMVSLGSGTVNDAFIPIMPAVQYGERLALTTSGYLYHFKADQLIQEYKWVGEEGFTPLLKWGAEQTFNHISLSLLVYWKIAGEVVTDQYLVYRSEKLSKTELDQVTPAWLDEQGIKLDIKRLLDVATVAPLARDTLQKAEKKADITSHRVVENPTTQQRETWAEIAQQYDLSALELLNQNAHFHDNPIALKIGDTLNVRKDTAQSNTVEFDTFEYPPEPPSTYNSAQNSHYQFGKSNATLTNRALLPLRQRLVKKGLPLVNIKPEHILRIGVFFDGTGQNEKNDEHKETRGDKSRTNIARLFAAYPEKTGESAKIYVSGVGTLDGAWQTPEVIDKGEDESKPSSAFGVYDDNGAFQKWQILVKELNRIISLLGSDYQTITHLAFDVFGFSRGAALARHFINVLVQEGLPDYRRARNAPLGRSHLNAAGKHHPNLLGGTHYSTYSENNDGYHRDNQRSSSVRFVGLFDTVGSFYLPGDNRNGGFQLHLNSKDVGRAFQICAHHEYRINFPLSSLKTKDKLPPNFHEEVFPGAHTDVGGGYPFVKQYDKTNLPVHYGVPTNNTYNRELIKTLSYQDQKEEYAYQGRLVDFDTLFYQEQQRHQIEWKSECKATYSQHGKVEQEDAVLYFYRLQPIDASLAGLAQERMKQQAERFGVEWFDKEYRLPKDYEENTEQTALWEKLKEEPLGSITFDQWQADLPKGYIHRSHDKVINPGCATIQDGLVDAIANLKTFTRYQPNAPLKTPNREVYDNE
ncbi:DUF2235 domain-containing protein [Marinomonas primoryensis]|uniref:DUF2235 domain-containing protein n=1 Tax=Marinomonas primoryensis TaxID=178399 RepID=A0A859D308_9GAMM|nr:DUF2235 domain-containing protein [Marinomonas primoryensis]QKK81169.1 DUF2235 domain-containing protein [Marinomonas primoryensis]